RSCLPARFRDAGVGGGAPLLSVLPTPHSLVALSPPADARVFPSGLNATEPTSPLCPVSVSCSLPVLTSHSLISFPLAAASVLPSGLNATRPPPVRVYCSLPVATSHSLIVSPLTDASVLPTGSSATHSTSFEVR